MEIGLRTDVGAVGYSGDQATQCAEELVSKGLRGVYTKGQPGENETPEEWKEHTLCPRCQGFVRGWILFWMVFMVVLQLSHWALGLPLILVPVEEVMGRRWGSRIPRSFQPISIVRRQHVPVIMVHT
jgi:hypothetical protein